MGLGIKLVGYSQIGLQGKISKAMQPWSLGQSKPL